jgi:CubicO group peptidase (beta-lactamase class C family)
MAIEERKLKGVNQRVADFIPSWEGTPKTSITLRHIMTMTSGIEVGAGSVSPGVDAFEETAAFPLQHNPGEHWAYNTPVYRMLLRILELASGESINQYTKRKMAAPIGMSNSSWDCAPAPAGKTNCTWYRSCLRDMARFGLLILRNGEWDNRQLVSAGYIKESTTTSQKLNRAYGYLWWLNGMTSFKLAGGREGQGMLWPDCPADALGALGAQDKKIYVVPGIDLVVARHGGASGVARGQGEGGGRSSFDNDLLGRICRAVK